jgi:hypothetical protein
MYTYKGMKEAFPFSRYWQNRILRSIRNRAMQTLTNPYYQDAKLSQCHFPGRHFRFQQLGYWKSWVHTSVQNDRAVFRFSHLAVARSPQDQIRNRCMEDSSSSALSTHISKGKVASFVEISSKKV